MNSIRDLIAALKSALTWWVTVAPWEQAIRVRLGKNVRLLRAGVHLRIPGFDRFYIQTVRRRVLASAAQTVTTSDGHALTVATTIGYRIADLLRLYETLHHAEGSLLALVAGSVGNFVGSVSKLECSPNRLSETLQGDAGPHMTVNTFAFVRTFRFITGEGHAYSYGDGLETSREHQVSTATFTPG